LSKHKTGTMPLMGHLGELRKRITYVAIVVVVFMIAAFIEKKYVFAVIMHPLKGTHVTSLMTLAPTEAFMQVLKVSIYAGLICAVPFILYQFWAFILPGLYENEKRSVFPYMSLTTILFLGGLAFGYFIVLPIGLRFMVEYGGSFTVSGNIVFNQQLQAERYIGFVSMFELAFGLVFELPLIMMLLAWAGVLDHKKMRKWRKYAILIEAVVAMVLTPSQDPVSMALMLAPLIVLYEFGILLARVAVQRKDRRREAKALAAAEREAAPRDEEPSEAEAADPQVAGQTTTGS
jgi:sec-independent protein translocase protein TatC